MALTEIRGNSKLSIIKSDRSEKRMRRYSSGKSPNLTWQMEANLGQNFEDFVAKIIMAQLRQLHPQVQVFQTRRIADG